MANTPADNMPYLLAVVIILLLGLTAMMIIAKLRPALDIGLLAGIVSGFIVTISGSTLAFLKSQETHKTVNSRMDGMLSVVKELAHERGLKEGRDSQITASLAAAAVTVAQPSPVALTDAEIVSRAALILASVGTAAALKGTTEPADISKLSG